MGVGHEVAVLFSKEGGRLALAARNEQMLRTVSGQIEAGGNEALIIPTDVRDPQQCEQFIRRIITHYGRLDILVNNAGIGSFGPAEELSLQVVEDLLAVNYKGAVSCSLAAYRQMLQQGSGHIIHVASIAGKVGLPRESAYVGSKHALVGFAQSLKKEALPHGIRVDTICPGGIDTPFWEKVPMHQRPDVSRFLKPEAVAQVVLFLASAPADVVFEDIIFNPRAEYLERFT
jgi:NAD(P)-dependent dehydrogenase (short-subunit alcohol dehydrogenase family)